MILPAFNDLSAFTPAQRIQLEQFVSYLQGYLNESQGTGAYDVPWTDYSDLSTIVGWSSFNYGPWNRDIHYKRIRNTVFVYYVLYGTSNSTSTSFTLPFAAAGQTRLSAAFNSSVGQAQDNGAVVAAYIGVDAGSQTAVATKGGGSWTASGTKVIAGQFFYETA